jgi:hypothetical protein
LLFIYLSIHLIIYLFIFHFGLTGVPQARIQRNIARGILHVKGKTEDQPSSSGEGGPTSGGGGVGVVGSSSGAGHGHGNDGNAPFSSSSNPDSTGNLSSVFTNLEEGSSLSNLVADLQGSGGDDENDVILQSILLQAASLEQDLLERKSSASSVDGGGGGSSGNGGGASSMASNMMSSGVVTSTQPHRPSHHPQQQQHQQQQHHHPSLSISHSAQASNSVHHSNATMGMGSNPLPPQQSFSLTPMDQTSLSDDDQKMILQLQELLASDDSFSQVNVCILYPFCFIT